MKVLLVRTDRLGDVLLTTPISGAIRDQNPEAIISWLVKPYTAPLLEHNPAVDHILLDRGESMRVLIDRLRQERFDAAIVAYPRWRMAWALWRAGIPIRIGPASKPYSLLFTHRLWQHRSEGKKHEADYNLELIEPLGLQAKPYPTVLVLTSEERQKARAFLESMRVSFKKPVVVLHPGSGGSSERWPLRSFMALGDRLQESGYDVVVTAGPGESYQSIMIDQMKRLPVFVAAGSVSVRQLAAIFSCASLVVSNSTGPLHMAVAVGVPTVSIYSPVPTCHPTRWGPYPSYSLGDGHDKVALAPISDGVPEMASVPVERVWTLCRETLGDAVPKAAG